MSSSSSSSSQISDPTPTSPLAPLLLPLLPLLPSLLLAHFLHLPSLALHSLLTYLLPDAPRSDAPLALLASKKPSFTSPPPSAPAQLFRLPINHSRLATRLNFYSFHLSLLLPLSLSLPSFTLPFFTPHSPSPLLSFSLHLLSLSFLLVTLLRVSLLPVSLFSLLSLPLSPLLSLLITPLTPLSSSPLICSTIAVVLTPLLLNSAFRFGSGFWLGTDQLNFDLPVLSCSWVGLLLLYSTVIVSVVSPLLFVTPLLPAFLAESVGPFRVWGLAIGALLQILSLRAMVQMYLNEGVVCWYQQLHGSRSTDLGYARTKLFLHNHRFCTVATQLVAPPLVVLLLLAIYSLKGDLFDSFDFVKDLALFTAWWVMFAWSVITMSVLSCYRFGFLVVS